LRALPSKLWIDRILAICKILGGQNELVLSHNDLHSQNMIWRNGDGRLFIIDFDYSCFNYRGFDVANFFNEFCFDYEYPKPPYF
jgi:choline/ethanolamine kinase